MTDERRQVPTIVVGLGNPILGDDGVGWRVVDVLERRLGIDSWLREEIGPIQIERLAVGGLSLMERLVGCERVLIVDAAVDGKAPGTVWSGSPGELVARTAEHLDSAHDVTLSRALAMAVALGSDVPDQITVVTVSVSPEATFSECLSPAVADAVEPAVDAVIDRLAATPVLAG